MALDRLPGPAGGNAHALVVVALGAARGERVAEPEAVAGGDPVGDVGEGRGALVRRDHQIGIVAVVADHVRRRHHRAAVEVVGDVQQPADEGLVTGDALGLDRLAVAARGQAFRDEPALRADRHDHGVLHHLGLHQPQHLGAEILSPVRPADPPPRHRTAAQMHALHPRGVDEDLVHRTRLGQLGDPGRIELEGDAGLHVRALVALVEIGAQRRAHQPEETAQDTVLVQVRHRIEAGADLVDEGPAVRLPVPGRRGVETGAEEPGQCTRDGGIAGERRLHVLLAEGGPGLAQVLAVGAQHRDLAPAHSRAQHQAVEAVVLRVSLPDALERFLELLPDPVDVEIERLPDAHAEVVHPYMGAVRTPDPGRLPGLHPQAHVLEHGQRIGQRYRPAGPEQLEVQHVVGRLEGTIETHRDRVVPVPEPLHAVDVVHRHAGVVVGLVVGREGFAVTPETRRPPLLSAVVEKLVVEVVAPVAGERAQTRLQLAHVDVDCFRGRHAEHEVQAREDRFGELHRELHIARAQDLREQVLDLEPHVGVEALSRYVDDARNETSDAVPVHEETDPLAFLQMQDPHAGLEELVVAHLEEQIPGKGLHDVEQGLGGVAVLRVGGALHHPRHLLAQQRYRPRHLVVGGRGVQPEETPLPDDPAPGVETLDAYVVEVAGPVHRGPGIGLGDEQQPRLAREPADLGAQACEGRRLPGLRAAQQAESRSRHRAQLLLALAAEQLVLPVPEEGEMVGGDPLEKGAPLRDLRRFERQRPGAELREQHPKALPHRLPVPDRDAHVVEHAVDVGGDVVEHPLLGLAIDLDVDHRFGHRVVRALVRGEQGAACVPAHPHHRMDDEVGGKRAPVERHAHGIDEEGHVVRDHLHDGMGGAPSVLRLLGVVDAHLRLTRPAPAREVEMRERRTVEVDDAAVFEILPRGACVVRPREGGHCRRLSGGHALAHETENRFDYRAGARNDRVR